MVVYIDSFFFVNFIFDIFVLLMAGRLMGARLKIIKILISAAIGAFFSCGAVLLGLESRVFLNTAVIALMSLSAFSFGSMRNFIKQTIILYVGFFISGGACEAMLLKGEDLKFYYMIVVLLFTLTAVFFVSGKIKERKSRSFAEITVLKDGKEYMLTALYDSGNTCRDFVSGLPVIISEDVFSNIKMRDDMFVSASGYGKMGVFYPDEIRVSLNEGIFIGKDVAIGVIEGRLSSDRSFNALIGGNCFERFAEKNKEFDKKPYGRG